MSAMENAHALVDGIADCAHISKFPSLVRPAAQDIYNLLIDSQYCGYLQDDVILLPDSHAPQKAVRNALGELAQRSNQDSTLFVYLSCPGSRLDAEPYAGEYLLPAEARPTSDRSFVQTVISGMEFTLAANGVCRPFCVNTAPRAYRCAPISGLI